MKKLLTLLLILFCLNAKAQTADSGLTHKKPSLRMSHNVKDTTVRHVETFDEKGNPHVTDIQGIKPKKKKK